jgi:hypothetical protein
LFTNNNHYFSDHDYLRNMLVVTQPDNEYAIAQQLKKVIKQREAIIKEYINYAPSYNDRAKKTYQSFLQ